MRSPKNTLLVLLALVAALLVPLPAIADVAIEDTFVFPQDPLVSHFTDSWGDARSAGRSHKGTDIMAPKGTSVFAIADGEVTIVRTGDRAGRWIAVVHGDGWESWYMHLNNDNPGTDDGDADWSLTLAPGIEEGAVVSTGQLLGWVGDSGNAEPSSPHTHFELHRNGVATNPYPYLRATHQRAVAELAGDVLPALHELIGEMGSTALRPVRPLY